MTNCEMEKFLRGHLGDETVDQIEKEAITTFAKEFFSRKCMTIENRLYEKSLREPIPNTNAFRKNGF